MIDVVAIGDTTQDIFLEMSEASLQCEVDGTNCRLCLDYAEKIPVNKKTDIPAVGNAANHAIGVARLGLQAAIYTIVGNDVQGHLALEVFKDNGVATSFVTLDEKRGTNFSAVINFQSERTILVYHEPREYQLPDLGEPKWLYLTSASGAGVSTLHEQVLDYLQQHPDVKLSFNPGTHQMNLGLDKLKPLLACTEILFLNREESARVLGIETHDITQLVPAFHNLGVKTMVITDGPKGAYASDGSQLLFLDIFAGPVIERTGAGDSFGSGFLSAVVQGKALAEAMLWGNANSTSVVQYIGAREGLLKQPALEAMILANPTIRPVAYTG